LIPAISTFLVAMSIRKKTWYRISPTAEMASTVKKSAAAIAPRCALVKVAQDVFLERSGVDTVLLQNSLDRAATDLVAEVAQGALEARISPSRVLCGHLE